MQDFKFHNPDTLDEALAIMDEYGEDSRPISGGTALVVLMKQSLVFAEHLVNLRRIPGMNGISFDDGRLRIGALTTHRACDVDHAPGSAGLLRALPRPVPLPCPVPVPVPVPSTAAVPVPVAVPVVCDLALFTESQRPS